MKKLLIVLIVVSCFSKVSIADMDTERIVGRNIAEDIEKELNYYIIKEQVAEIKKIYCRDAFNILNLFQVILQKVNLFKFGNPLIDDVNDLIKAVEQISKLPDDLDYFSLDKIEHIRSLIINFDNYVEIVSSIINHTKESNVHLAEIINEKISFFNQEKKIYLEKEQEAAFLERKKIFLEKRAFSSRKKKASEQREVNLKKMNCE